MSMVAITIKQLSKKVTLIATALAIMVSFTMQVTAGQIIAANKYTVDDRCSGYPFATKETNAIQNPARFRV